LTKKQWCVHDLLFKHSKLESILYLFQTGNHQNSILTSSYMAQKFNGLDNKRNTFSVTPTSHVRQSAWFLPFENTNMKIKSSFDKQDFLRRLKACCSGLTIGVLLASIALAVILTLWLYRSKLDKMYNILRRSKRL